MKMEHIHTIKFIPIDKVLDKKDLRDLIYFNDEVFLNIIEVLQKSPIVFRRNVELAATYLKRGGYSDFTHYSAENFGNEDNDRNTIGYLFTDHNDVIGACLFRLRENKDWVMHWVWIHPYFRSKGILSQHVDFFNKRFGCWYVELPHSKAMEKFLEKNNLK